MSTPVFQLLGQSTGTAAGNRIAVADPSNPSQLIFVEARQDANGNLVPVDSRYNVRSGYGGGSDGGSSTGILFLVLGAFALFALTRSRQ